MSTTTTDVTTAIREELARRGAELGIAVGPFAETDERLTFGYIGNTGPGGWDDRSWTVWYNASRARDRFGNAAHLDYVITDDLPKLLEAILDGAIERMVAR